MGILDTQVSLAPTHVSKLVGWSVGPSVGPSVTLSDFQSLVSNGRSNQKVQKTKSIYFQILLLGGPVNWSPTQSTGPQPIQLVPNPFNWSPKTVFYRNLSIGRSNQKIQKLSPFIFEF